MKLVWCWGIIFFVIFSTMSCASKKELQKPGETDLPINEDFDPLALEDDDIIIPERKQTEARSEFDERIFERIESDTTAEAELVSGYRVQICAFSDERAAREIRKEAILKFNQEVYLTYDSPYYKVRIGDCLSRFEADNLQQLAIEKGFKDAWVVRTKVLKKPEVGAQDR
jgi:hypothetical protein